MCFAFQKGQCPLSEKDCTFTHQAGKKGNERDRSPSPPRLKPGTDKSKLSCVFFAKGKCSKGADCEFSHDPNLAQVKEDE